MFFLPFFLNSGLVVFLGGGGTAADFRQDFSLRQPLEGVRDPEKLLFLREAPGRELKGLFWVGCLGIS